MVVAAAVQTQAEEVVVVLAADGLTAAAQMPVEVVAAPADGTQ